MSNVPGVFLELAYQDDAFFTGSSKADVIIRSSTSNQSILFGTKLDDKPVFDISQTNMNVYRTLVIGNSSNPDVPSFDVAQGNAVFNSNIYVNDRIGVGTMLPSESIDVQNGNVKFNSNLYLFGSASIGMTSSNPTENLEIGSNIKVNSNAFVMSHLGVGTSNPTEIVDIDGTTKISSNLYVLSNISVGTSNPKESLDIRSNAIFRSNAYVLSRMSIGNNNSNPTQTLDVYGNAKVNGLLYVTSNAGLGTMTPAERLDVFDNAKIHGNVYALSAMSVGASWSNPTETLDIRGNTKISSNTYHMGNSTFGHSNPTEKVDILGNTKITGNLYTTNMLSVGHSNPTEKIDVSGNILANSNVYALQNMGIGTIFPKERIDCTANIKAQSNIYAMNCIGVGTSNPEESVHIANGNLKVFGFVSSCNIATGTSNPTEALDISANAKIGSSLYVMQQIGVGTSNIDPNFMLYVKSNITANQGVAVAVENSAANGYSVISTRMSSTSQTNGGTRIGTLGPTYVASGYYLSNAGFLETDTSNGLSIAANNTTGQVRFYTGGTTEQMRIDINGSIGINTTNPTEKLDIIGNTKISSNLYVMRNIGINTSNTTEKLDVIGNAKISNNIFAMNNLGINTSNTTERLDVVGNAKIGSNMYVLSNIGINTSNTTEKLDVIGNAKISNNIFAMNTIGINTSNTTEKLDVIGNAKISSNMYVLSNIGINTSNTTEKLDVIGNAKISSNMYVLSNIGINTSNTTEKLDVVGNAKISNNIFAMNNLGINTSNTTERLDVVGNAKIRSNMYVLSNIGINTSNTTEKLDVIGNAKISNNIYAMNNIGINTSNTTEKLDVIGNAKISSNMYVLSNLGINTSNTTEKLDVIGNAKISSNMYVLSNLGINTSNTTETLDVIGNAKISSNMYVLSNIGINTSNTTEKLDLIGNAKIGSNLYVMSNLGINTSNTTEKLDVVGNAKIRSNIYVLSNIGINTSNTTEKLDVIGNAKISNNIYAMNTIGINTSNTTEKLDVVGNAKISNNIYAMNNIGVNTSNTTEKLDVIGNAKIGSNLYVMSNLGINTSNTTEKLDIVGNAKIGSNMYVLSNIGINTSNTTEKLDVVGNAKISSNLYVLSNLGINTSNTTEKLDVIGNAKIGSNLYVMSNLGINTSNTTEKLDIVGNAKIGSNLYVMSNLGINTSNTTEKLDVVGNAKVRSNMYVLSNIGINTSNTTEKLDVIGNAKISNNIYAMNTIGINTSNTTEKLDVIGNAKISSNMYVLSNIGINTSNTTEKLDVVGNAKISSNVYAMNNVGIGTSNISATSNYRLHVAGNAKIEGNLDVQGIYNITNTEVRLTDQFTVSNDGTGPALKVYQIGAQPIADFYDDTNIAMRIADGGLIGIGKLNPAYTLDVNGSVYAMGYCNLLLDTYASTSTNNAPTTNALKTIADISIVTSNFAFGANSTSMFTNQQSAFFSSNTSVSTSNVTISLSNYVYGSNTTNITAAQTTANWSSNAGLFGSNTSVWSSNNLLKKSGDTMTGLLTLNSSMLMNTTDNTYIGVNAAGLAPSLGIIKKSTYSPHFAFTSNNGNATTANSMFFGMLTGSNIGAVSDCNLTTMMTLTNAGNLGIGTVNPSYKLDVNGTLRSTGNSTLNTLLAGDVGYTGYTGIQYSSLSTAAGNYAVLQSSSGQTMLNASTGQSIMFRNNNIDQGGWSTTGLGIGTTTPSTNLHVNNDVYIAANSATWNTTAGKGIFMRYSTSGAQDAAYIQSTTRSTSTMQNMAIQASNIQLGIADIGSTPALYVQYSGNVGIGTSTPSYTLDVGGTIRGNKLIVGTNGSSNAIYFGGVTADTPNMTFIMERLYDPVYGSNVASDYSELLLAKYNDTSTGAGPDRIRHLAGAHKWQVYTNVTSGDTNINLADSNFLTAMYIDSNANVAIGSSNLNTTAYKLDVSGATRISGNVANIPDITIGNMLIKTYNKSLTATALDFTNICTMACTNSAFSFQLNVVHSEANSSESKSYTASVQFASTSSIYYRLNPLTSTGAYAGSQDWAVEINNSFNTTTLRLVRVNGTASAANFTCTLKVFQSQTNPITITDSSTTGSSATNSGLWENTQITQVDGFVGIGTEAPAYKLDVNGVINSTSIQGPTITALSNLGLYGSNTANWSSNTTNYSSNTAYWSSNTAYWASNNLFSSYGGIVSGNLDVTGSLRLGNSNSEIKTFSTTIANAVTCTAKLTFASGGPLNAKVIVQVCRPNSGSESTLFEEFDVSWSSLLSSPLVITSVKRSLNWSLGTYQMIPSKWYYDSSTGTITLESARSIQTNGTFMVYYTILGRTPISTTATADANTPPGTVVTSVGFIINENSNVGIGTASPTYKLDISGDVHVPDNGALMSGTTNGYLRILGTGGVTYIQSGLSNASSSVAPLVFGTISNTTEWARFITNGNFGIGTTSPSYKLDISGTLRSTSNGIFNTALVGDVGYTGYAGLQNSSLSSALAGNYAILQSSSGQTILNASTGQTLNFRINNGDIGAWTTTGLGVGTISPSYKLHVSGDIYSTGNVTAYSDIRAKSNLEIINSPIEKVSKLTGYTYEMISPPDLTTKITPRYTGIVAQDLEKVLPEAVHKDKDGNYSVAYGNMAGLFVEAIKELTVENKELKNTVLTLEERIFKLENIISTLM